MKAIKFKRQSMVSEIEQYGTVIVGLGKTGTSLLDYFVAMGHRVLVMDSRQEPPGLKTFREKHPDVESVLGTFDADLLSSAGQIALSPGVSVKEPAIQAAIERGVRITSDIEIFYEKVESPVIAVTGSNGKSTVVSLLSEMIREDGKSVSLVGNIGNPVLDAINDKVDFFVLELSSFQLEILNKSKNLVSSVLNVSPDHLDRYESVEEYAAAKERIFLGEGYAVVNNDDPVVLSMQKNKRRTISFGGNKESDFYCSGENDGRWIYHKEEKLLSAAELRIKGKHNLANAMAALAIGNTIGLSMSPMLDALRKFPGLPHRCEWVGRINGIDWYNDSKGTNTGASCAAIEALAGDSKLTLIAGGDGKGADFEDLAEVIVRCVDKLILIGKDAARIAAALPDDSTCVRHGYVCGSKSGS